MIMIDPSHLPDWVPFACLVTGKLPVRTPFVTKIIEGSFIGIVAAGFTFVLSVKLLEKDLSVERARLDSHLVRYEAQIAKRDAELTRDRVERMASVDQVLRKLERIEDCIRVRSCTR